MIDIKNLSIQFTGDNLFENVNLKIAKHDKIALVGSNGKGKSTFLKLIYGIEIPETGSIDKQKGISIGYLQQDLISFKAKPLFDEVKTSLVELHTLVEKEKLILESLNSPDLDTTDREELVEELGELTHRKEELDYYSSNSRIEKILMGLGFAEKDFYRMTDEFSGGWQMRIQLAKILLAENDLILLDEPTNHLDIDTLSWLIDYLKSLDNALIVVSHDRHFINNVTSKTLEVYNNQINFFPGAYEQYLKFKDEREVQLREQLKVRERKIKEVERFIERFRYKATKAKQVQSRIKQLEKIETINLLEDEKIIDIKFPDPPRSGSVPIELKDISKSYGTLSVLKNINLQIERGEKIAIVGPNGAGKTTLAKILGSKILPTSGEIIYGSNTIISYYEQEVADSLNPELDLVDTLEEVDDQLTPGQIRKLLGSFLFSGDDVFKKIKVLSGGEKSRVALSRLLLTKSNFIILDEPTNHLDFSSKEILQKAIINYPGTLAIVSHDIDFLRPIITKVYELGKESLKIYYGGIDYFFQKRNEALYIEKQNKPVKKETKFTRKDQKRIEAELRQRKHEQTKKFRESLNICENRIKELESLKTKLEQELSDPSIFSNPSTAKTKNLEYDSVKKSLETEYEKWTELTNHLEEIDESFNSILSTGQL
ncbi:MAG: ribosomal protection-like ABC-F family protein [Bacteroidota bacterium]